MSNVETPCSTGETPVLRDEGTVDEIRRVKI